MNVLVVGFGSIGARHARVLSSLGCRVAIVSSRPSDLFPSYLSLMHAVTKERPEYVVVANRTHEHYQTLVDLAQSGYGGIVLVEKPLFQANQTLPGHAFRRLFVGYNLRFHPVVEKLVSCLENEKILSAQVYVGQYLPDWRPQADYRRSYSAHVSQGGGVLRDLSHELDILMCLFGNWQRLVAVMGHYSHLEIESEDIAGVMLTTTKCPMVTLQMNYCDRIAHRQLLINTDRQTLVADLNNGVLREGSKVENFMLDRDLTYVRQHMAILEGEYDRLCTLDEGMAVMAMVEAIECSALREEWVSR